MHSTNHQRNRNRTLAVGVALRDAGIAWGWALSMAMYAVFWDYGWLHLLAHVFVFVVVVGWFVHRLRQELRARSATQVSPDCPT